MHVVRLQAAAEAFAVVRVPFVPMSEGELVYFDQQREALLSLGYSVVSESEYEAVAVRNVWHWDVMATNMTYVVFLRATGPLSRSGIESEYPRMIEQARRLDPSRIPIGFQHGRTIVPVYTADSVDPDAVLMLESPSPMRFAEQIFPMAIDRSTGRAHYLRSTRIWGSVCAEAPLPGTAVGGAYSRTCQGARVRLRHRGHRHDGGRHPFRMRDDGRHDPAHRSNRNLEDSVFTASNRGTDVRTLRISGAAGLLFVAVAVSSAVIQGQSPGYTDPGAAAWFAAHAAQFRLGQFLSGLGFLLFYLPFLAGLYAWLRSAEESSIWPRVLLTGGVLFPAAGTAGGLLLTGLAIVEGAVDTDTARLALAAGSYGIAVSGAVSATVTGPASLVILRHRLTGAWLGWLGAAVTLGSLVGSASVLEAGSPGIVTAVGQFAWLGFFLWAAAASACMLGASQRAPRGSEAGESVR